MTHALGRRVPPDFEHVDKYPLTRSMVDALSKPTPVVVGVNWYQAFDRPEQDSAGHYWIGRNGQLGSVRGGHCFALKPRGVRDNTAWWDFYDQGSEGACFPAGTLIELADGSHKPIERVQTLERVRTAEGREGVVLQTHARMHVAGLVRVRLRGHDGLRCTADHPILTRDGYVSAGQLQIGDQVRLTAAPEGDVREVFTADWLAEHERRVRTTGTRWMGVQDRGEVTATITAAPDRIALTPGFGRIVGLWLAEGSTTANKVTWSFGGHERDTLAAELMERLREELSVEPRLQVRGNGSLIVVIYGKHWRMLFERMLSHGPYDKSLPGVLASGPRDFLRAVLEGWLAGDGHRRRGRWQGVTVSRRLAMSMYRIAQHLMLAPTIRFTPGKPNAAAATRRGRWDLEFSESAQADVDTGGAFRKVVALEADEFAGHVFNLYVDRDNSYVADGFGVHNCVGFGVSRAMTLLNRRRYFARWLWDRAKQRDQWPGTNPGDDEGTSVRAGLEVARDEGLIPWNVDLAGLDDEPADASRRVNLTGTPGEGIKAYRWIRSIDDLATVLGYGGLGYVDLINSWGRDGYPHLTRVPLEVVDRLWREDGEFGVPVDK